MIRSSHSIHIDRPVHDVFDYLRDHENRIYWQGNLTEAEHSKIEKGTRIVEVRNVLGRRVEIAGATTEFRTARLTPPRGSGGQEARIPLRVLMPDAGGTRLDTELDLELSELFGIAGPVIQRLTDRELDHAHTTLKDIPLENQKVHEKVRVLPGHRHQEKAAR